MLTSSEENYLKAIYHLSGPKHVPVSTNAIAEALDTKAASVTDMIKKLDKKRLVTYHRYQGVAPSPRGLVEALKIVRKHRLWEVFLVNKLKFRWDEVHDIAEQMEHISSPRLINRLERFLGNPQFDPHGDPIPTEEGEIPVLSQTCLLDAKPNLKCTITSVNSDERAFLKYLDKLGAYIGATIQVLDHIEFDGSLEVSIDNQSSVFISKEAAQNIQISDRS